MNNLNTYPKEEKARKEARIKAEHEKINLEIRKLQKRAIEAQGYKLHQIETTIAHLKDILKRPTPFYEKTVQKTQNYYDSLKKRTKGFPQAIAKKILSLIGTLGIQ